MYIKNRITQLTNQNIMNSKQKWLCEILEACKDDQDHLPWWKRDWDQIKIYGYIAASFAMQKYLEHDREVLARILRCFCDADAGGIQHGLLDACESFCENPRENEDYISEVTKAAPEMLKKSPVFYGDFVFGMVPFTDTIRWNYFINTFQSLSVEEKQIIVDYLAYTTENSPENSDYKASYEACLSISGLEKGNSRFFWESIHPSYTSRSAK